MNFFHNVTLTCLGTQRKKDTGSILPAPHILVASCLFNSYITSSEITTAENLWMRVLLTGRCKQTQGLICLHVTTTCCIFTSASSVPEAIHFSLNTNTAQYDPHTKTSCENQAGTQDKLLSHLPRATLFHTAKVSLFLREVGLGYLSERAEALKLPVPISRYMSNTTHGWTLIGLTTTFTWKYLLYERLQNWGRTDRGCLLQHDPELPFLAINLGTPQGQVTRTLDHSLCDESCLL